MPATDRLYYTGSYATRVQAQVVAASADRLRIQLDHTVFYPTSGGQPNDTGFLNGIPVTDVIDDEGAVIHVLAAPLHDNCAEAEIDWPRRYSHMQQHTGQHLLSAVFEELFGFATLSFHMGADTSSIELDARELAPEQMEAVVQRTTNLARANPSLSISFEDATHVQGLRKASQREGVLRIVEIPGIDKSACGGTHVACLAEVLPLQIREQEKIRGNIRVSFVCGDRALRRAQSDFQNLSQAAQALGVPFEQIQPRLAALQQRLAASGKYCQSLEGAIATREGLDLYHSAALAADGLRRCTLCVPVIGEAARAKAKAFTSQTKAILLMHSSDGVLIACSPDAGVNAGAVLKQVLSRHGARGGGSTTLAQGSLPDAGIVISELSQALGQ